MEKADTLVVDKTGTLTEGRPSVVGIKQVADSIWLVSFMHDDLGFFDDRTCRLEPVANPFEVRNVLPMSRE